jgi:hypothetical protein
MTRWQLEITKKSLEKVLNFGYLGKTLKSNISFTNNLAADYIQGIADIIGSRTT